MRVRGALLCAAALTVAACGGDDSGRKRNRAVDICEASPDDAQVTIGTSFAEGASVAAFLDVEEGGVLELVHGPQGGFHVEIGLRAAHLDTSKLLAGELRGWINGEMLANVAPWFLFTCTDEGQDSWGTLLIFRAQPEELHLQTVEVELDLTDASGTEVFASGTFLIEDPELL